MPNTDINIEPTIDGEKSYQEWLTDTADAIREKGETTDLIKPVAFPSAIRNIENTAKNFLKVSYYSTNTPQQIESSEITGVPRFFYSYYMANGALVSGTSYTKFTYVEGDALELGFHAFDGAQQLLSASFRYCYSMSDYALRYCLAMSDLYMPKLRYIGKGAFDNCQQLKSLNAPLCEYIGDSAFTACIKMTDLELGSPYYIGEYCFTSVSNASISLGFENVTRIGAQAFSYNSKMNYPVYAPNCSYLGGAAFARAGITAAVFPSLSGSSNNALQMAPFAFSDCNKVSMICLGTSDRSQEVTIDGTFFRCNSLDTLIFLCRTWFYHYATGNYSSAFSGCSNLMSLYLYGNEFPLNRTYLKDTPLVSSKNGVYGSVYVLESLYSLWVSNYSEFSERFVSMTEEAFKSKVKEIVDEACGIDSSLWGDDSDSQTAS